MKGQIIQNVFKLMLGTSAFLVSVTFFIRTVMSVTANDFKYIQKQAENEDILEGTIKGCGSGIYQWKNLAGPFEIREEWQWVKIGPEDIRQPSNLERLLESASKQEEQNTTEPLTFDPVLKKLFSKYPCMKSAFSDGRMKKISDSEFTIRNGSDKWTITIENESGFYTKKNDVSIERQPVKCE